ncbi:hypothetical protein HY844_02410 [Candidatus Berkelbacteria bacterium]|nr:hypothetical protein [Candidatus Berkelbacteria bacterium]
MINKLKSLITIIVSISLILLFIDTQVNKEVFIEKYGMSASTITILFIFSEIAFNLGILIMLRASGIFKIKLKDLLTFNFSKIKIKSKLFFLGFGINRISAAVPWIYIIGVGWRKLPMAIISLIVLELIIITILTIGIFEIKRKYEVSTS